MQFYTSPEQIMRDRSEYARKGIARGRSVVVLTYEGGVLFVAENPSTALHKVSEIYDRIGFAAVGRYNEFDNLRAAGVRMADLRGYSYDRRDVTGRALANAFAQTLGAIFVEQTKPFEVEICVAQVGAVPEEDELYRLTYDGSVGDEPGAVAMGGQAEAISTVLRKRHERQMSLSDALALAVEALGSVGGEGGQPRTLPPAQLEVAVLDRQRSGRTFRRITGAALASLLGTAKDDSEAAEPAEPSESEPAAVGEEGAGAAEEGAGAAPADAGAGPVGEASTPAEEDAEPATPPAKAEKKTPKRPVNNAELPLDEPEPGA